MGTKLMHLRLDIQLDALTVNVAVWTVGIPPAVVPFPCIENRKRKLTLPRYSSLITSEEKGSSSFSPFHSKVLLLVLTHYLFIHNSCVLNPMLEHGASDQRAH